MTDCTCCEGLHAETPVQLNNRPGLNAIAYRIGTHSTFKASMLAGLTTAGIPALRDLKTRDDDDFSIALLDAWATVADVLTFYQERIANESYLRTATERLSLRELARLIGYKLRPGVAANAYLAFTLETAPGSPTSTVIEVGVKVQSIPKPGEKAQTFETIERITAYAAWNAMQARLTTPQPLATNMSAVRVQGTNLNLAKGDALLIIVPKGENDTDKALRLVSSVTTDDTKHETVLALQSQTPFFPTLGGAVLTGGVFTSAKFAFNNNTVQNEIVGKSWSQSDLNSFALQNKFSLADLFDNILATRRPPLPPPGTGVFALRKRASLFGYNAPDWNAMARDTRIAYGDTDLNDPDWSLPTDIPANQLFLDQVYQEIQVGDWVAVTRPGTNPIIARVQSVSDSAQARYAISGKATQLTLDTNITLTKMSELRQTTVFVRSESLPLADLPDLSNVAGATIALQDPVANLAAGQKIIVSGARSDLAGVSAAEVAEIADVSFQGGYTTLTLSGALLNSYVRDTVTVQGNVALATHGETTSEILGNGDAARSYQAFTLKQPPLTYISAATADGAASTLDVFVNDVRWHEADSLYGTGPRDHVFVTGADEPAAPDQPSKTTVRFGDGVTGARPPTGTSNIRATYRKGIGKAGNVDANQLSMLLTRPLGVKGVNNPLAASGGDDMETLAAARTNAPLTMLTLGRIVSLQDYQDFARAFAGVAKTLATWTWDGQTRGIFLTIAGPDGAAIPSDSPTFQNLVSAMRAAGDPYVPVRVQTFAPAFFTLSADIKVDPDYQSTLVLPQIESALRAAFAFDARAFGQPVALSQILEIMHSIPGVVAADVNALYRIGDPALLHPRLAAAFPRAGSDRTVQPAELLLLDPRPLALGVMA